MKKDIQFRAMEYIGVAIVAPETPGDVLWDVYLFNFQDFQVRNVMVSAHGFGVVHDKELETATMRYFFDDIAALDYKIIEPLHTDLFVVNNQYWVSFQAKDGYLYDKKFIFEANFLENNELTMIPFINRMGIMVQ
jgi:hypothetical protein